MKAIEVKRGGESLWFGLEAVSLLEKLKGLMFRKQVVPLLIDAGREGFVEIHSAFCPEFDVVFLTEKKVVRGVIEGVKPFSSSVGLKRTSRFVLEVPVGEGKKVKEGDLLSW